MRKLNILLIFIVLVSAGCSMYHIESEKITTNYYVPKKSADEVVYVEEVTAPHEIIGFVKIKTERRQDMEDIIYRMKKEAALLGGDAITNLTINSTGQWEKIHPQKLLRNAYVRANFTVTVIAYK